MAMNEMRRLVFFDEPIKTSKAAMAEVFSIMDKARGGMGCDQIDTLAAPQGETQSADKPGHLFFRVLVDIAIVPPRAGETEDLCFTKMYYPAVDGGASHGGGCSVADIMVAENIKQRHIIAVAKSSQIFRRQIAAGQDQLDAA